MTEIPSSINHFKALSTSTILGSRDIVVNSSGQAKLGSILRFSISAGARQENIDTMKAFRNAMKNEYGVFGEQAFDTVLSSRLSLKKSLRADDIKQTISRLPIMRIRSMYNESLRQLSTNPEFTTNFPSASLKEINSEVNRIANLLANGKLQQLENDGYRDIRALSREINRCKTSEELSSVTLKIIRSAIAVKHPEATQTNLVKAKREKTVASNEPTGLLKIKHQTSPQFAAYSTSVEDRVKRGTVGVGMRLNNNITNPTLLVKIKDKGVEPGFIARKDWTSRDTSSMLLDIHSEPSRKEFKHLVKRSLPGSPLNVKALEIIRTLFEHTEDIETLSDIPKDTLDGYLKQISEVHPKEYEEIAMSAGRGIKGHMAFASNFVLRKALNDQSSAIYRGFQAYFNTLNPEQLQQCIDTLFDRENADTLKEVKTALFTQLRNEIMKLHAPGSPESRLAAFQHFQELSIIKLDYNEQDRGRFNLSSGHRGSFLLPERTSDKFGGFYRKFRTTTADDASAGAVAEALANDLTRIMDVPTQELTLVEGQYSDGHRKLMLEGKFANGYGDFDQHLVDGRIVLPQGKTVQNMGSYKIIFMLLGDRDCIGSKGQNKGVIGNQFFAIDPGHSLEGNILDFTTDFHVSNSKFKNYSVFDDSSRAEKFKGVLKLKELYDSGKAQRLFDEYEEAFPNDDSDLSKSISKRLESMKSEFNGQLLKILTAFDSQLKLYEGMGGGITGDMAIEMESNLEKLTSPATWSSKNGEVELRHLDVPHEKRLEWKGKLEGENLVYSCAKGLSESKLNEVRSQVAAMFPNGEAAVEIKDGSVTVTISKDRSLPAFTACSENRVILAKYAEQVQKRFAEKFGLLTSATRSFEGTRPLRHLKPSVPPGQTWKTDWSALRSASGGLKLTTAGDESKLQTIQDYLESIGVDKELAQLNGSELTVDLGMNGTLELMDKMTEESLFAFKESL